MTDPRRLIHNDINNVTSWFVIPAQAGIQWTIKLLIMNVCLLDSRLRGNDERGAIYDVTYSLLSATLACFVGVSFTIVHPVLAEPDPGPIKVIRTEIDAGHENRLHAAYRAYRDGNLVAARAGYEDVMQAYPDNRDAILGLAACAVVEGDVKAAMSMYRRILRAFPQDVLSKAALIGLQEDRQGEAVIREFLSRQPDEPYLHVVLGRIQAAQARWPEARRAFSAAHRIDPANPVYALNLAISLDRMGQREEALEYYRATLKLVEQGDSNLDIRPVIRRILALRQQ